MSTALSSFFGRGTRAGLCPDQRGFTLIEMSIVLVIIGLIIGGIVKGQEVVNNARVKLQLSQIDAVRGAVYTFQDRYAFLPGDLSGVNNFSFTGLTSVTDGNQDGVIGTIGGGALNDNADDSSTEMPIAWMELAAADLLAGIALEPANSTLSKNVSSSGTSATGAVYAGKIGGTYLWLGSLSNTTAGVTATMLRIQGNTHGVPTAGIKVADASGVDAKYDDGNPGTGTIIVNQATNTTACVNAAYTSTNPGGAHYSTTGNPQNVGCAVDFLMQ